MGVCHSFLLCLGELPVVNSSFGSNCCTCNCQSTLQAILQELKTMRKLMQIQAGTMITHQIQSSNSESMSDIFSWDVFYCAFIVQFFPLLSCYYFFKYPFSQLFFQPIFLLEHLTTFVLLIILILYLCTCALCTSPPDLLAPMCQFIIF